MKNVINIARALVPEHQATSIFTSAEFHIGYMNEAMLLLWDKDKSIIGERLVDIAPEYADFIPILKAIWDSGSLYRATNLVANVLYDGELMAPPYDLTYQPMVDNEGKTYAIVATAPEMFSNTAQLNRFENLMLQIEQLKVMNNQLASLNKEQATNNENMCLELKNLKAVNLKFNDSNSVLNTVNDELKLNRTQLANALRAASLGSYDLDLETGRMECSDQCKTNFGAPIANRFDFKDLLESIQPEYRDIVNEHVDNSIKGNLPYNLEYQIKWHDDTTQWIQANGTPQYDQQGKPIRMVGVTQLITDKKNYQARKDEFLSVASHELKTPITVLKANLQLLDKIKSKLDNPTVIKLIEVSNRSMDKISTMLNELLDVGKYTAGAIDLRLGKFNINELLDSCTQHLAEEDQTKLVFEASPVEITADQNRIEQVLVNFVNNAFKYAPESSQIIVKTTTTEQSMRVSVQDFGAGIPKDQIPRLFDRYWQGDRKQNNNKGLGLGLYICSEIIKKHHGTIGADSELGKGSTFWFEIPLQQQVKTIILEKDNDL